MKYYRWHLLVFCLLRVLIAPFIKAFMGYSCEKIKGPYPPTIIIANHNTNLDPVLVALGFSGHMYFLGSEHAFRKNIWGKVLMRLCAPISINKTQADTAAIKEILRRLKAGFNVCFFAEGNRSYNGETGPIPPATAKLVKLSGAALITYRLEGGYLTAPRWAKNKRKGKMAGTLAGQYSPAKLHDMSNEEVLKAIERDIHENAYERQGEKLIRYRGKDLAEFIETALYLCPLCQSIGSIRSRGNYFFCACGFKAKYTKTGFLTGEALPFSTITAWDSWQVKKLAAIARDEATELICADDDQQLFRVQAARSSAFVGEGELQMTRQELRCAGRIFPLEQIVRLAIVDRMTLMFSLRDGTHYEIRSAAPRNALKYVEIFKTIQSL